jgi:CheY-like chemotaxis protein
MPAGGKITWSTQLAPQGSRDQTAMAFDSQRQYVCLEVRDSNPIRELPAVDHVFDPFFGRSDATQGAGLRLASVHGLVKQHEGWIEVAKEPGQGTVFRIYWPAAMPGLEDSRSFALSQQSPESPKLILLVEDEISLGRLIKRTLETAGYRIFMAHSGEEAIDRWTKNKEGIDLVITDVLLPGKIKGYDLAQRFHQEQAALPIIITSGFSDDLKTSTRFRSPWVVFMQKPFDIKDLQKVVRKLLADSPCHTNLS